MKQSSNKSNTNSEPTDLCNKCRAICPGSPGLEKSMPMLGVTSGSMNVKRNELAHDRGVFQHVAVVEIIDDIDLKSIALLESNSQMCKERTLMLSKTDLVSSDYRPMDIRLVL